MNDFMIFLQLQNMARQTREPDGIQLSELLAEDGDEEEEKTPAANQAYSRAWGDIINGLEMPTYETSTARDGEVFWNDFFDRMNHYFPITIDAGSQRGQGAIYGEENQSAPFVFPSPVSRARKRGKL
jgi:hypothetical protein